MLESWLLRSLTERLLHPGRCSSALRNNVWLWTAQDNVFPPENRTLAPHVIAQHQDLQRDGEGAEEGEERGAHVERGSDGAARENSYVRNPFSQAFSVVTCKNKRADVNIRYAQDGSFVTGKDVGKLESLPTKKQLIGKIASSIKQITTKIPVGVKQITCKVAYGARVRLGLDAIE